MMPLFCAWARASGPSCTAASTAGWMPCCKTAFCLRPSACGKTVKPIKRQAIGYKEFFPYFEQTAGLPECAEKLKQASRNYAKRQLTWFKRLPQAHWLDMAQPGEADKALLLVQKFLQE